MELVFLNRRTAKFKLVYAGEQYKNPGINALVISFFTMAMPKHYEFLGEL